MSRWYWDLSKPHLAAITPEMKKEVAELTAGAATDMEKIKAVFYYVSKKIRYMGITPEKDRPGFEPHDVSIDLRQEIRCLPRQGRAAGVAAARWRA